MLNITVKVEKVLERQSFTSRRDGATVNRYSFVAITTAEQYQKTICFTCLGDDTWENLHIVEGGTYQVSFDIASREWNGRYYTDINAFRAQRIDDTAAAAKRTAKAEPTPRPMPSPVQTTESDDDMPF